jgi:hypothetical protein
MMLKIAGVTNSPQLVDAGRRVLSTSSLSSMPSSSRVAFYWSNGERLLPNMTRLAGFEIGKTKRNQMQSEKQTRTQAGPKRFWNSPRPDEHRGDSLSIING